MGTITALVLTALSFYASSEVVLTAFPYVLLAITTAFLLAFAIGNVLSASALQNTETHGMTGLIGLFRQDIQVHLIHGYILFWLLLSLYLAMTGPSLFPVNSRWIMGVWLVLTGVALDMASYLYRRLMLFLSPLSGLQIIQDEAVNDIQAGRDVELCGRIDSLAETGLRASRSDGLSLCHASIEAIRNTVQNDFSWNRRRPQTAASDFDPIQRAGYILNYACERLALIYSSAHENGLSSICQDVISALGKISVAVAEHQGALVAGPVAFMGNLTKQTVKAQNQAAGVKLLVTLVQVTKRILGDQAQPTAPLERTIGPIIKQMDEVAKQCFRQDKSIPLPTLTAPFQELKRIFESERFTGNPDRTAILALIERPLTDFANVDLVMRTIPPLPGVPMDDEIGPEG